MGRADDSGTTERVPNPTAYERLAAGIQDQILAGELSVGEQLPTESELSAHYQVSRNTVREALRSLEGRGLVTVRRGVAGGAFVTFPSPTQVQESLQTSLAMLAESAQFTAGQLIEIREILEVPAAEMAALRQTDVDRASLREALVLGTTKPELSAFACSKQFHIRLVGAAHNPLLDILVDPIFHVLEERFGDKRVKRFWSEVDRDHQEILGYLEAGDQAGTREATRAHLRSVRATYEQIDRKRPD